MTARKLNPIVEIFDFVVIVIFDRYYLRRWLPPAVAAITAGVVVGLISGAFYLIAWRRPPTRLFLILLIAVALSLLLNFLR
jgi:F0F1-type ATP synthase membrane subunit c/vacuolar-type H+-ATPase subunit K